MAAAGGRFLESLDLRYLPYFWNRQDGEKNLVLDLLQERKYEDVLDLVQRGKVSPTEVLPKMDDSLLTLAFRITAFLKRVDSFSVIVIVRVI